MTEAQVAKNEEQAVQKAPTTETDTIYMPDVDISENNERIRLVADMPGVDQKTVEVSVENNVLTMEGQARIEAPEGYKLAGQEFGVGKYRRDFTLSDAVEIENIKARIRHGVLDLTIPKREETKMKKIEIGT